MFGWKAKQDIKTSPVVFPLPVSVCVWLHLSIIFRATAFTQFIHSTWSWGILSGNEITWFHFDFHARIKLQDPSYVAFHVGDSVHQVRLVFVQFSILGHVVTKGQHGLCNWNASFFSLLAIRLEMFRCFFAVKTLRFVLIEKLTDQQKKKYSLNTSIPANRER